MIRRPPRSTQSRSSAASDVYKRQNEDCSGLEVRRQDLWILHITRSAGGAGNSLPRPMVAAYMLCMSVPDDGCFGHSCRHGPPPHQVKVLVPKSGNDKKLCAELRSIARAGRQKRT